MLPASCHIGRRQVARPVLAYTIDLHCRRICSIYHPEVRNRFRIANSCSLHHNFCRILSTSHTFDSLAIWRILSSICCNYVDYRTRHSLPCGLGICRRSYTNRESRNRRSRCILLHRRLCSRRLGNQKHPYMIGNAFYRRWRSIEVGRFRAFSFSNHAHYMIHRVVHKVQHSMGTSEHIHQL